MATLEKERRQAATCALENIKEAMRDIGSLDGRPHSQRALKVRQDAVLKALAEDAKKRINFRRTKDR